jgi:hypothetical protein
MAEALLAPASPFLGLLSGPQNGANYVPWKRWNLSELRGTTTQKTVPFILAVMTTSNPTTFENTSTQYGSSFVQIIISIIIGRGDRVVMMMMMAGTDNHLPNMDSELWCGLSIGQIHKFLR